MSTGVPIRTSKSTGAVREMYEAYPYPSAIAGDSLIEDVANGIYSILGEHSLDGWRILDAGCGTGHRLIGTARRYPDAQFVGLDMTSASLDVARTLAQQHRVRNVCLEQGDIRDLTLRGDFDLVICTGVIVCLEDPQTGLQNLASLLAPNGLLMVWLYNAIGEHERMMQRELLHSMWNSDCGLQQGIEMMRDLGLQLEARQYGSSSAQDDREISQLNIDVDAYIHPIVNVYRLAEAIEMFRTCRQLGWAAINNLNLVGASKLIDLEEAEQSDMRFFCQLVDDLFDKETVRQRFRELGKLDKLRVIEVLLKPTGFTIIGGRAQSYTKLGPRIVGNIFPFQ